MQTDMMPLIEEEQSLHPKICFGRDLDSFKLPVLRNKKLRKNLLTPPHLPKGNHMEKPDPGKEL